MKPNHEPDELSEVLEAGYAAPPLDAAFSDELVRRMQDEVVPRSSLTQNRHAHRAIVLCGVGVAASILAVIYVWNPLGSKPARDEVAMQSVPGSNFELSSSIESKVTRSLTTASIATSDSKVSDIMPLDIPPAKSRGGEAARGISSFESRLESSTEVPGGIVKNEESKANDNYRNLLTLESMSAAVMEEFEIVTKERAKALGLSITSQAEGPDAVRVRLEFEKQGELKEYSRVELKQFDGDKLLLSVALKEGESKTGHVVVGFVAARSNLAALSLEIVAKDRGTRVRYVLPMKDFVTKPEGLTQP
jgi:hypothetical protein